MAINIIKHGEKKFKTICPICGCEFEYEYEDIDKDYLSKDFTIKCPDCGYYVKHEEFKKFPSNPIWEYHVIPTTEKLNFNTFNWPDCATCPNKPDPTKTVVGDTPCTWCRKNQPYCTTSFTSDINTVTNTVTNYSEIQPEVKKEKPVKQKLVEVKKKDETSAVPDAAKYFDK